MRSTLARLLRNLATWIDGGESDLDLRARMLNIVRRGPYTGSCESIEAMIRDNLPVLLEPTFEWSRDRKTMTMRLM